MNSVVHISPGGFSAPAVSFITTRWLAPKHFNPSTLLKDPMTTFLQRIAAVLLVSMIAACGGSDDPAGSLATIALNTLSGSATKDEVLTEATALAANLAASDGVIHAIDKVLAPAVAS